MKKLILSVLTVCSLLSVAQAADKVTISSYVGVDLGGDIGQYQETMGMHRNATRKMYMDEVVEAAMKLSQGGMFDPTAMLGPLQKLQDSADKKRDINKEIDSVGIGFSAGELFKTEIEKIYKRNGLTKSERRIEFVNQFPKINGKYVYNSKVQFDHYVYLHITHVGRGVFKVAGTLGSIAPSSNGIERSFEGTGSLLQALAQSAEEIFAAVMENDRPAWNNPNPQLTWIPGPKGIDSMDEQEAKSFCMGQNARLPLAEEMILAHHGTNYRQGGINRFKIGEVYHTGDQRRQAGVPIGVIFQNDGNNGSVLVQPLAGHKGKVWCVKGLISDRNMLIKKLFQIRRKADPKGVSIRFFPEGLKPANLEVVKAVESLLINLGVSDARLDSTISQKDFMGAEEALEVLRANGHDVYIPEDVLANMI